MRAYLWRVRERVLGHLVRHLPRRLVYLTAKRAMLYAMGDHDGSPILRDLDKLTALDVLRYWDNPVLELPVFTPRPEHFKDEAERLSYLQLRADELFARAMHPYKAPHA